MVQLKGIENACLGEARFALLILFIPLAGVSGQWGDLNHIRGWSLNRNMYIRIRLKHLDSVASFSSVFGIGGWKDQNRPIKYDTGRSHNVKFRRRPLRDHICCLVLISLKKKSRLLGYMTR